MSPYNLPVKRRASKIPPCILVLWGDHFDEVATTLFVVTLRQAGLCVRVVGVHGLLAVGRNGLAIHADLSLSEVKTVLDQTVCLVLPCSRAAVKRLENDPRIHELFAQVVHNAAKVVLYDEGVLRQPFFRSLGILKHNTVTYPQEADLVAFVQDLANTLAFYTAPPLMRCAP